MKSYYIHLIRHADSNEDDNHKYIGITDLPISTQGFNHLRKLKSNYIYPNASIFYTSPLIRCVQTLKELYPNSKPNIINGLCECNFGKWENKSPNELSKDTLFQKWLRGEKNITPPGGESSQDFIKRICTTFEAIVNNVISCGNTQVVIMTHGGIISMLLSIYGFPKANFSDWKTEPCCGFSLQVTPSLWMKSKVVEIISVIPKKAQSLEV